MRYLKGRGKNRGAVPKLIDECIYTPYTYTKHSPRRPDPVSLYERRHSTGGESVEDEQQRRESLIDAHTDISDVGREHSFTGHSNDYAVQDDIPESSLLNSETLLGPSVISNDAITHNIPDSIPDFDITVHMPEVFLFDYGVVVIWGMTESQETKFLKDIAKFELEKLAPDDVETEHFNFYYTQEYQARIYNDFITLRDKNNYMTKLAISHALAQSVKVRSPFCLNTP